MRAVMLVKGDATSEGTLPPDSEIRTAMGRFNDEMQKAGVMLSGEGLKPSSSGARVQLSHGKFTVKDGPFAEAKELIGGFWLIQTKTREEALSWLKRVPILEDVELRPLYETEDFPVDPAERPDGWRDKELAARDEFAAKPPARKPGTKRFILMLKGNAITEAGAPPNELVLTEMGALMEEGVKSGALLGGEGLKPTSSGARLRVSGGERYTIDGPFAETKELIAGYCMLQLPSLADAVAFSKRWLTIHEKIGVNDSEIEIRELLDAE